MEEDGGGQAKGARRIEPGVDHAVHDHDIGGEVQRRVEDVLLRRLSRQGRHHCSTKTSSRSTSGANGGTEA